MSGFVWALLAPGILLLLAQAVLCAVALARVPRLSIDPRYRRFLEQHDIAEFNALNALPGGVVSGHPDRHVAQVVLGGGPDAVRAYLKREHIIPWKERLASAWLGFGFTSKSCREFWVLQMLRDVGIDCPEPIAAGEDGRGRAFVLVREVPGGVDLHEYLREHLSDGSRERGHFFRRLAEAIARVHDAGFRHPDLYAEHLLVEPDTGRIRLLDWQRSRRRRFVSWGARWQDLAALHATLVEDLASPRERLAFLRAYLHASLQTAVPQPFRIWAIRAIDGHARRLLGRRRIRDMRRSHGEPAEPKLFWLDGEALCVTGEFQKEMQGQAAEWLREVLPAPRAGGGVTRSVVPLPGLRQARLVCRRTTHPLRWLWASLRRHRLKSPETEQAGAFFRLRDLGLGTPRLLAVGQRHPRPWRTESFLLTEEPADTCALSGWLAGQAGRALTPGERHRLLREAGALLRRLHDAGFPAGRHLAVRVGTAPCSQAVVLGSLEGLRRHKILRTASAVRDVLALDGLAASALVSRSDRLRFLLAYLGSPSVTPTARQFAQAVRQKSRHVSGPHSRPADRRAA
jgi:tRNA A-37 threonylcarbamoyl transferase component Bud32